MRISVRTLRSLEGYRGKAGMDIEPELNRLRFALYAERLHDRSA